MTPSHPGKPPRGFALPGFVLRQFDRGHPDFDHRQRYLILQSGMRESVLPAGTQESVPAWTDADRRRRRIARSISCSRRPG